MPVLREFNTQSVHPPHQPAVDTKTTLKFPRPFTAPPRLPHGFRQLDVAGNTHIHVKSTLQDITEYYADYHITTWDHSTLHCGIGHVLALAPGDLEFLTGEHMRNRHDPSSVHVTFERPFIIPPKVVVFFNYLDLDKDYNWRARCVATDINVKGFTLKIETWGDTILYGGKACWIAYPADREHIFSTSVNTSDVRHWGQPQHKQSKRIAFSGGVEFSKVPEVFVALNSIDIRHQTNLRVNAYVDAVSTSGLVWHIDSWWDTVLYSAGASIIAFN